MLNQWKSIGDWWSISSLPFKAPQSGLANQKLISLSATFSIPPNAVGIYSIPFVTLFLSSSTINCYIFASSSSSPNFPSQLIVNNPHPQVADIMPPIVYELKIEKKEYKAGETIRILAYIADHSLLYIDDAYTRFTTLDNSLSISCYASWNPLSTSNLYLFLFFSF